MTPCALELPLPLKIYSSQGEKEIVLLLILFLLFEELSISNHGFQGEYHVLAECSGQVKVC
jgi:hypothetical protein